MSIRIYNSLTNGDYMFQKVYYKNLKPRQKENYNFQKMASKLAEYGFNCLWLNDDYEGADFIALHIDRETILKVQLKGRLEINRKYCNKDIHVAFRHKDNDYIYAHDGFLIHAYNNSSIENTQSWKEKGLYNWPNPPSWALNCLTVL